MSTLSTLIKAAALASAGAAGALIYAHRAADRLTVTPKSFLHSAVPRAFHGYRIAQFSDIHIDETRRSVERLHRAVDAINAAAPDLIVCTGDFVTQRFRLHPHDLTEALRRLRAPDGVLAILGNHDHRYNRLITQRALAEVGITELENAFTTLRRGADALHIAGVDSMVRQRARLDAVLAALPADGMAILLAHEPDYADIAAASGRFTLQLSGHTHGGQINLPLARQLGLPVYGRRYIGGFYNVRGMWLYVNRGIGTSGVPLRLRARPEITIFTLGYMNLLQEQKT
ncbi:MAG: metallophosphoesterase [Anaerolineae bacterium]|nr:metallophosphoesterase [Anaerolineae bacterium]NUQ05557.1 metallophosphoesterase [Anaerolineae bacterium]